MYNLAQTLPTFQYPIRVGFFISDFYPVSKGKDHNGMALESVETLVSKINKLHQKNWRIEIHVIGDRSVDNFLGFYSIILIYFKSNK